MKRTSVREILDMIPEAVWQEAAASTKVDKYVKLLKGRTIFQLFLISFLEESKISLSVLEQIFNSTRFKQFSLETDKSATTSKSSLSDRLRSIKPEFFEKLFMTLSSQFSSAFSERNKLDIVRFDSTILTLSSKLLKGGWTVPVGEKNQIKFTVSFNGLPKALKIFNSKGDTEEIALRDAVLSYAYSKNSIAVFDRGLQSRKTFQEIEAEGISFVTRLGERANYKILSKNADVTGHQTGNLLLIEDIEVYLRSRNKHWIDHSFRLIKAKRTDTQQELYFLTNRRDLSACQVCEIYKRRWDIEVFFKFIKQELHAKHFLSRSQNGIKSTFYMVLILALLLLIYKQRNELPGYKFVRYHFTEELRLEVIRDMVILCGGCPKTFDEKIRRLRS